MKLAFTRCDSVLMSPGQASACSICKHVNNHEIILKPNHDVSYKWQKYIEVLYVPNVHKRNVIFIFYSAFLSRHLCTFVSINKIKHSICKINCNYQTLYFCFWAFLPFIIYLCIYLCSLLVYSSFIFPHPPYITSPFSPHCSSSTEIG